MNPSRSRKSGGQNGSHLMMILSESVRICVNFNTWLSPGETSNNCQVFTRNTWDYFSDIKSAPHMMLDLHWSLKRCHSLSAGPWCPSPSPSSGSLTCRVWSCDGRTCDPAGWSGCVWTSPTADAGSGYRRRRTNTSCCKTHDILISQPTCRKSSEP